MNKFLGFAFALTFSLAPVALAGSAGSPVPSRAVAPFGTAPLTLAAQPANWLVKTNQTWVMNGVSATGEKLNTTYKLGNKAPAWGNFGWEFDSQTGIVSYLPEAGSILFVNSGDYLAEKNPLQMCVGRPEGQHFRGVLLTGDLDSVTAELAKLPTASERLSAEQFLSQASGRGVKAGTCTVTRK